MFTVLILEDDYEQQKAVSKIINEHYKDWQIFIAGTYKEACNLTSTKCFDLFLLYILSIVLRQVFYSFLCQFL